MSTAAVHDEEPAVPAAFVIEAIKCGIKELPDRQAKIDLWHDFQAWLQSVPPVLPDNWNPWDRVPDGSDPDARIARSLVKAGISRALHQLAHDYGRQMAETASTEIAATLTSLEAGGEPDHTGMRQCAKPRCRKWFTPVRDSHIYCSTSCRSITWQAGKRAEQQSRAA